MASAAAGSWSKRWIRPEVWPLFFATGTAVGICGMQLIRNITGNPEVRCVRAVLIDQDACIDRR